MQNNIEIDIGDMTTVNVTELVDCLKNLHERLVSNYNDGAEFNQFEEDRSAVLQAVEIMEEYIINNNGHVNVIEL